MKKQSFNLSKIKELTLYTGTNGKYGCSCNCPGCSQTNYGKQNMNNFHQGTLKQIEEIINILPELEKAYFLGNPDCSVDPEFCSKAARLFIEKGIHVMFSTSGIGGEETIKKLLDDVDLNFIDYISFSIDSLDSKIESALKGVNIPFDTVLSGIEYCQAHKIPIKIQPTVWQINQNTCIELMEFFRLQYEINWFTFHTGSFEGFYPLSPKVCRHVLPDEWHKLSNDIIDYSTANNVNTYLPAIFLTESELEIYKATYIPHCTNPEPTNLQIWMEDTLKSTFYPILNSVRPTLYTQEFNSSIIPTPAKNPNNQCPVQTFVLGHELSRKFTGNIWEKDGQKLYSICRYYKKGVN